MFQKPGYLQVGAEYQIQFILCVVVVVVVVVAAIYYFIIVVVIRWVV
jgi:hypothetical protein